jgi:hypothetical protein
MSTNNNSGVNMPSNVSVLLDEEYGYRTWLWETGMTGEQLLDWWMRQTTMNDHFFDPSRSMPGKLKEVTPREPQKGEWTGHIHMDDDSFLTSPDGRNHTHAGHTCWADDGQ